MPSLSQVSEDVIIAADDYYLLSLFLNINNVADIFGIVKIEATKEGVKFSCKGDIGSGAVTVRPYTSVEKPDKNVSVSLSEPVALTFSLKYLVNFCKATQLSDQVKICLSLEVPLLVEFGLGSGHLRFYLAPKVCVWYFYFHYHRVLLSIYTFRFIFIGYLC